jgi:hypothetical protein
LRRRVLSCGHINGIQGSGWSAPDSHPRRSDRARHGLDGQITWPSERGLYFLDTRIISNWAIYANGEPWELLNGGPINYYSARIFLANKSILSEDGPIPPRTLGLTISRTISLKPVRFSARNCRPIRLRRYCGRVIFKPQWKCPDVMY